MQGKARDIGPYSKPHVLAKLDRRTREARHLESVRADLTAHLGGNPSATQRRLIERAAWLSLRVAMLDAAMAESGVMTDHDSRTYLAWSNSLSRVLAHLGLKGSEPKMPTLEEQMEAARLERERQGAAA